MVRKLRREKKTVIDEFYWSPSVQNWDGKFRKFKFEVQTSDLYSGKLKENVEFWLVLELI